MKKLNVALVFTVSFGFAALSSAGVTYKVSGKVSIDGNTGWDYLTVDSEGRRLYIAHGDKVDVVDVDTEKVVGSISGLTGVHGVAIATSSGMGFISDGRADHVTRFDLTSLRKTGDMPTGKNPDAILFDPATSRVFAFNGKSQDTTILDANAGSVLKTLPLPGKPEFATADGAGSVYVNIEDKNSVVRIDSNAMKVEETWALPGCEEPSGMAQDTANHRLFIGCGNKTMVVVNAQTGNVIATLPIGDHVDATAFDPGTKLVFNSNGDGSLTVIQEDSADQFRVIQTVSTQRGARTMAVDPKTHDVFLVTAKFGAVPKPTDATPRPRPAIIPGTFTLLVLKK